MERVNSTGNRILAWRLAVISPCVNLQVYPIRYATVMPDHVLSTASSGLGLHGANVPTFVEKGYKRGFVRRKLTLKMAGRNVRVNESKHKVVILGHVRWTVSRDHGLRGVNVLGLVEEAISIEHE